MPPPPPVTFTGQSKDNKQIKFLTLNIHRNITKKTKWIMNTLQTKQIHIAFLQETNKINNTTRQTIENDMGGTLYVNQGREMSLGTAVWIHPIFDQYVKKAETVIPGRCQKIELEIHKTQINIWNTYTPNTRTQRETYLQQLKQKMLPYQQDFNLIGGDHNFTENKIDRHHFRKLTLRQRLQKADYQHSATWKEIKEELAIMDIRHDKNTNDPIFTYSYKTGKSRLDRFYISTNKKHLTENDRLIPTHYSDHDAYSFALNIAIEQSKPKIWKLNTSILEDQDSLLQIQDHWKMWQGQKLKYNDPLQWWDAGKEYIKKKVIHICSTKKKERKQKQLDLQNRLDMLEKLYKNPNQTHEEKQEIQKQLREIELEQSRGIYIRSRIQDITFNEKHTKLFFHSLRDKETKHRIEALTTDSGKTEDPEEIISEVTKFYTNLYTKEPDNETEIKVILNSLEKTVNEQQNRKLIEFVTTKEVKETLFIMNKNKSPGDDGLPVESYQKTWPVIGEDLTEMINNVRLSNQMTKSQKGAIVSLLYKKNDKTYLKNWRPISLLNIDYKIISKIIATRLKKVLPDIISPAQTCGVPGRQMQDNIWTLTNLIEKIEHDDMETMIIAALDQEKAFDRVSHSFMLQTLKKFGFHPDFIEWVETL